MLIKRFYGALYAEKRSLKRPFFVSRWSKKKLILVSGKNKVAQDDVLCSFLCYIKPKVEKNVYFLSDILDFPRILNENSHIPLQVLYWEAGKMENERIALFLSDLKVSKVPTVIIDDEDEVEEVFKEVFTKRTYWGQAMRVKCAFSKSDWRDVIILKLGIVGKGVSDKALEFLEKLPSNSVFAILKLIERLPGDFITLRDLYNYELFWGDYEFFLSDLLFKKGAGAVLKRSLDDLDVTKFILSIRARLDMICKVKTTEGMNKDVENKLGISSGCLYEIRKIAKKTSLQVALKRLKLVLTLMRYRSKLGVIGTLLLYW